MTRGVSESVFQLIRNNTTAHDSWMKDKFIEQIQRIYQYEIFKPFMDFTVTMIKEGKLKFKVAPKQFFELDNGNCLTVEGGNFDKILGIFKRSKAYTITIKKITPEIILHEIGHMIEEEINLNLESTFVLDITKDLKHAVSRNLSLVSAINNVMVKEVAGYPANHRSSELFTRFFQLIAMAKEVAGLGAEYAFTIKEVYFAFPNTEKWVWDNMYKIMIPRIDISIARQTKGFIIPLEEIMHEWAKEKIEPTKGTKPWSKVVKSIKD